MNRSLWDFINLRGKGDNGQNLGEYVHHDIWKRPLCFHPNLFRSSWNDVVDRIVVEWNQAEEDKPASLLSDLGARFGAWS